MKIRADIAELLRAGRSARAIARELHVDTKEVRTARILLGLPPAKSGPRPADSIEDLFWRRVQPTDDGHMLWTGYVDRHGTPCLRHSGQQKTAYRVAFQIRYRRQPEGKVTSCGRDLCVSPRCVEDRLIRERTDHTYAAIFGSTP